MKIGQALRAGVFALAVALAGSGPGRAAEPIKLGFSMALTGGGAAIGKQILLAFEIWRDDINAKGGLLGRPVALVYYDDQTNPAAVPAIYAKLLDIDKVDLLVGPYATNMVMPAIPVIMQHNMTTIGIAANAANSGFHYPRYFSMIPSGPEPKLAFSRGFLELAAAQQPRPQTLAILGADAEYGRNATDGARENARSLHFTVVSVGILRAAGEIGLDVKMFGGAMIGPSTTSVAMQLGPLLNGLVNLDTSYAARNGITPGIVALVRKYQSLAVAQGVDPLGYTFPPYAYAACEVLATAVTATQSLDHAKIAAYIAGHPFATVVGDIAFGKDGEWQTAGMAFTQFQHVRGHDIDQFRTGAHLPVLWPPEHKTGDIIYPYAKARE